MAERSKQTSLTAFLSKRPRVENIETSGGDRIDSQLQQSETTIAITAQIDEGRSDNLFKFNSYIY